MVNTDLALVLVVAISVVGYVAGRRPAIIGALVGGSSFDLLHTRPYDRFAIAHARDLLTTLMVVGAGLAMAELASRLAEYRRALASEVGAYTLVTEAAGLIATGGEASLVVGALSEELVRILHLKTCRFQLDLPSGKVPCISRDGTVLHLSLVDAATVIRELDLPVWVSGEIIGHFRLELMDEATIPSTAGLRLAVSISDQAGFAVTALGRPETPPPLGGPRRLRLHDDGASQTSQAPKVQLTGPRAEPDGGERRLDGHRGRRTVRRPPEPTVA